MRDILVSLSWRNDKADSTEINILLFKELVRARVENPSTGKQYEQNLAHLKKVAEAKCHTNSNEAHPEPGSSSRNETSLGLEDEFMGFTDEESEGNMEAL